MTDYDFHDTLLNSQEINCTGRDRLPPLMTSIKRLIIHNGTNLKSLTPLPPNLRVLKLRNCRDFTAEEYAAIPPTVLDLQISDMYVRDFTALPQWITRLVLTRTTSEELPAGVFPNLKDMDINYESRMHTICVPPSLTELRLSYMSSLTKIVAFSPVCEKLYITNTPKLTMLPPFPSTLKCFGVWDTPITMLPPFPNIHIYVRVNDINLPPELQFMDSDKSNRPPPKYQYEWNNYPDDPKWLARINPILEEYDEKTRTQKRTRLIRPELLAAAYSPERVAKWVGEGNWDLVDTMMGIA